MDKEKDFFQEDGELQEILGRFENMRKQLNAYFFDVFEFEKIIDHYLDTNHFNRAIDAVSFGKKQHPGSTTLEIKEAQVYAEKGDSQKALEMVGRLELIDKSNNEVFMLKGMILNQLGKVTDAEQAFEKALELSYENVEEILYDISLSFQYVNQYKTALLYLEKAYKRNSRKLTVLYDMAYCHDRLHDIDRSISYYEAYLDIEPYSENVWYNLGLLYFKKENFRKAVDCYDYSIAINDQYSSAVFNKANALANLGEYEDAIETYKDCILLEPENVLAHCYLGESLEKLEQYEEAIGWYEKATKVDASYSEGWYGIAVCYLFQKLYRDALFYVNKAIVLDDENPDFWFTLGNIQAHLGANTDAIKAYSRTCELDPYDDEAWINLAHLKFKQGATEKAINVLKDSYTHTINIGIVNFHLSAYYHYQGNSEQALKFFEEGLKLEYSEYRSVVKVSPMMLEESDYIALLEKYLPSRNPGKKN
ncbi:MAG TPA: tetratricopeptide repeat protein [Bacteroides sp.]|nr:tetratricopeptide repeat protein [Bacteroides sp.]